MRTRIAAPLILLTALAAAQTTYPAPQAALDLYHQKLAVACPGKRLDLLPPAELLESVDSFTITLTSAQKEAAAAMRKSTCRDVAAGATCDTTGFLQAAAAMGRLDDFVQRMCDLPKTCTAQSTCAITR